MTKKVLVGLSGGVDSAVSAYLLKQQGYDVSAGFMINYLTDDDSCPTRIDMAVAREVAEYLEIPFFTFDFIHEYEQRVLKYIFEGYSKGLTPNPDVFCNTWVKFDLFREEALSYGYDAVATGHYARINESDRTFLRGVDPEKDQSYFLSALTREQLSQAIFPIGHLPKSEVREIARKAGLPNAERKDSQGLCFVGKVNFGEFLKKNIEPKKGPIKDVDGKVIGEHDGAFQYTIGQRKGIGVGGGPARYVVEKDVINNIIFVGEENDARLYRLTCRLTDMNWLADLSFPLQCEAQIRYRQVPQKCTLKPLPSPLSEGEGNVTVTFPPGMVGGLSGVFEVTFDSPQRAITPGQVCAIYDGDRVLGSGIIGL